MNFILQPLRVTMGWLVEYNNALYEIDPDPKLIPEAVRWLIFKEDMLQIVHLRSNRLLDLGWYPEGDLDVGAYRLRMYVRHVS